jgi:hypothetical protein
VQFGFGDAYHVSTLCRKYDSCVGIKSVVVMIEKSLLESLVRKEEGSGRILGETLELAVVKRVSNEEKESEDRYVNPMTV